MRQIVERYLKGGEYSPELSDEIREQRKQEAVKAFYSQSLKGNQFGMIKPKEGSRGRKLEKTNLRKKQALKKLLKTCVEYYDKSRKS